MANTTFNNENINKINVIALYNAFLINLNASSREERDIDVLNALSTSYLSKHFKAVINVFDKWSKDELTKPIKTFDNSDRLSKTLIANLDYKYKIHQEKMFGQDIFYLNNIKISRDEFDSINNASDRLLACENLIKIKTRSVREDFSK